MSDIVPYSPYQASELIERTTPIINPLNPSVPRHLARKFLWLPDKARNMGINLRGGKGSGKSTLMAMLAWFDFIRSVPLVVIDPVGSVIDGLLFRICRLPREYQLQLWPRIKYVDMAAKYGYATGSPLYYRIGKESLYTVSQRYPDVIRRVDPWLNSAPIQGFNSLWKIATYTGMALSALDCQITEAEDLLRDTNAWLLRLGQARARYPELEPVVDFFHEYSQWNEQLRASRTEMFLTKIAPFTLDPAMKAMFGANMPGVRWDEVISQGQAVLLDFRNVADHETRRFKLIWCLHYFLDYIRHRGAGRGAGHRPLALYIDELASLFHMQSLDTNPLQEDLDELVNIRMRSHMIWLCAAYQEAYQLDECTQKTLLTLGTQIFGSTSDMDTALETAKQFFPIDPYEVKRYERVWHTVFGLPQVIDRKPVEFSVEEQQYLASYKVKDQRAFHFLVRPAQGEGTATGRLYPITIANFDRGIWPDPVLVEQARALLSKRSGIPVETALTEINKRVAHLRQETNVPSLPTASAKMNRYGTTKGYNTNNRNPQDKYAYGSNSSYIDRAGKNTYTRAGSGSSERYARPNSKPWPSQYANAGPGTATEVEVPTPAGHSSSDYAFTRRYEDESRTVGEQHALPTANIKEEEDEILRDEKDGNGGNGDRN